jgi:serine/threonine-protein kinase
MTAASPAAAKPRRIGNYTLGRRIGAGGMAAVFAARQEGPLGFGRLCAYKVMSSALVGDAAYERMFLREAGITARLEHRNAVRVYEVGEADGALFIAMELVHGPSLRDVCRAARGRLPLAVALAVARAAAAALDAAHELADAEGRPLYVVHQDVTPHNIMVTYEGVTKLLDFGVARLGSVDASRTVTVRGKPSYLAPEQLLGESIDRRTDVYALGVVLFELVTGVQPFQRRSELETYAAVSAAVVPPLRELAPDVPAAIADVCDHALERVPEQRFQTAAALARALEDAQRGAGVAEASEAEIARYVRGLVPAAWQPQELEIEIVRGATTLAAAADVADLPTESRGVASSTAVAPARRLRWPVFGLIPVALAATAIALIRPAHLGTYPRASSPSAAWTHALTSRAPISVAASPAQAVVSSAPSAAPTARASRSSSEPLSSAPLSSAPPSSAPPSSAPPPSAPPAQASIAVRSTPWGTVLLDGTPVGNSPRVIATTPGWHTVTVRTADGRVQSRRVEAKTEGTALVQIVF